LILSTCAQSYGSSCAESCPTTLPALSQPTCGLKHKKLTYRLAFFACTWKTRAETPETRAHREIVASRGPSPKKTKSSKRFKWSNDMIAELLRLRFAEGDVKRRLECAQTKTQTALAWQYFASVLSQLIGVVIKTDQVSENHISLQCFVLMERVVYVFGCRFLKSTANSSASTARRKERPAGRATARVSSVKLTIICGASCTTPFQVELELTVRCCWTRTWIPKTAKARRRSTVPVVQ